jgi:hypothetical protein
MRQIHIMVDQALAQTISKNGSGAQAMQTRYGLRTMSGRGYVPSAIVYGTCISTCPSSPTISIMVSSIDRPFLRVASTEVV